MLFDCGFGALLLGLCVLFVCYCFIFVFVFVCFFRSFGRLVWLGFLLYIFFLHFAGLFSFYGWSLVCCRLSRLFRFCVLLSCSVLVLFVDSVIVGFFLFVHF